MREAVKTICPLTDKPSIQIIHYLISMLSIPQFKSNRIDTGSTIYTKKRR